MKLKSLFSKLISPKKNGNDGLDSSDEGKIFQYHLQASNIEGQPTYPLTDFLAVGSEVGDVVLDDPSLSAKHCTFFLKDKIVSIIDHNSVQGTFINDKKIPSAKMIILQEGDYVRAGEIEFDILKHAAAEATSVASSVAQATVDENQEESKKDDDLILETQTPEESADLDLSLDSSFEQHVEKNTPVQTSGRDKTQDINPEVLKMVAGAKENSSDLQEKTSELKPGFFARLFKRKAKQLDKNKAPVAHLDIDTPEVIISKKPKASEEKGAKKSFWSFSRKKNKPEKAKVKAVVAKEPLANSLIRILALIMDLLIVSALVVVILPYAEFDQYAVELELFITALYEEHLLPHVHLYIDQYRHYIDLGLNFILPFKSYFKYYYLLIIYRMTCAVLFTKTLGQLFIGIRSSESFIWSRMGGMLRELFACIFLPLMPLFDAPLIFGIKSFKEGLSFTRLELRKSYLAWIGGLFFLPLCIILLLISPLLIGFNLNIDQVMDISDKKVSHQEGVYNGQSEYLSLKMINGDLAPLVDFSFDIAMKAGKTYLIPYLAIQQQQKTFNLSLRESFKMSELIQRMEMYDYFFASHYPSLSNYSHELGAQNPNFSRKILKGKDLDVFKAEFKDYLTRSLNLNLIGLETHVPARGPFLLGYVLSKRWLLEKSLLSEIQKIFFIDINEIQYLALVGTSEANTREAVLLPLINEKGMMYSFALPKDLPMLEAIDQLEKNILPYMQVMREGESETGTASGKFLIYDLTNDLANEANQLNENSENVFHEKLSSIISIDSKLDQTCLKIIDFYIKTFTDARKTNIEKRDIYENVLKYLNQAKDAIENNETDFFEIIKSS
jgi:hypothetical protein